MEEISKILIAVDNSDFAAKAAKRAIDFAKKLNSKVGIVFVIETVRPLAAAELTYLSAESAAKAKAEAEAVVEALVSDAKIKAKTFIKEGNPWEAILACAKDFGADLITLSTHGRTGVMHLLMGSVAESVVQHSNVPVLIYPSKHFK